MQLQRITRHLLYSLGSETNFSWDAGHLVG